MLHIDVVKIVNTQQSWVEANFATIATIAGLSVFTVTTAYALICRIRKGRQS